MTSQTDDLGSSPEPNIDFETNQSEAHENVRQLVHSYCNPPGGFESGVPKLVQIASSGRMPSDEEEILTSWLAEYEAGYGIDSTILAEVLTLKGYSGLLKYAIVVSDNDNTYITSFPKLVASNQLRAGYLSGFVDGFEPINKQKLDDIVAQYAASSAAKAIDQQQKRKNAERYKRELKRLIDIKDQLFIKLTYYHGGNRRHWPDIQRLVGEHDQAVRSFQSFSTDSGSSASTTLPTLPAVPDMDEPAPDVLGPAVSRIDSTLKPHIRFTDAELIAQAHMEDLEWVDNIPANTLDDIYDVTFTYVNRYRPFEGEKVKSFPFTLRSVLLGECDRLERASVFQSLSITSVNRQMPPHEEPKWQSAYNPEFLNRRREISDQVESQLLREFNQSVARLKATPEFVNNYKAYCYGRLFEGLTAGDLSNAFKPIGDAHGLTFSKLHIRETFALAWLAGILEPKMLRLQVGLEVPDLLVVGTEKTLVGVSMLTGQCEVLMYSRLRGSVSDWLCGAPEWVIKHFSKFEQDIIRETDTAYITMQPRGASDFGQGLYQHLLDVGLNKIRRNLDSAVFTTEEEKAEYDHQMGSSVLQLVTTLSSVVSFCAPGVMGTLIGLAVGLASDIAQIVLDDNLARSTDQGDVYMRAKKSAAMGRFLIGLNAIDLFDLGGMANKGLFRRLRVVRNHFLSNTPKPGRTPLVRPIQGGDNPLNPKPSGGQGRPSLPAETSSTSSGILRGGESYLDEQGVPILKTYMNDKPIDVAKYERDYDAFLNTLDSNSDEFMRHLEKLERNKKKLATAAKTRTAYKQDLGSKGAVYEETQARASREIDRLKKSSPDLEPEVTKDLKFVPSGFQLVRGSGEPGKRLILSAHGAFDPKSGLNIYVPRGKKVVFYGPHGNTLSDVPDKAADLITKEKERLGMEMFINGQPKKYASMSGGNSIEFGDFDDVNLLSATGLEGEYAGKLRNYKVKHFEKSPLNASIAAVWENRVMHRAGQNVTPTDILIVDEIAGWDKSLRDIVTEMKPGGVLDGYDEVVFYACREPMNGGARGPNSVVHFINGGTDVPSQNLRSAPVTNGSQQNHISSRTVVTRVVITRTATGISIACQDVGELVDYTEASQVAAYGTMENPRTNWSEETQVGQIHVYHNPKTGTTDYFEAQFNGRATEQNRYYFPQDQTSNQYWKYMGGEEN